MRADILLVIACIIFLYVLWVATGGPQRPISRQGPFITPVQRSGEEQQGYRFVRPVNPVNQQAYPRQIEGEAISVPEGYVRTYQNTTGTENAQPVSGSESQELYAR